MKSTFHLTTEVGSPVLQPPYLMPPSGMMWPKSRKVLQPISCNRHGSRKCYSSGRIAIAKGSISDPKFVRQLGKADRISKSEGPSSAIQSDRESRAWNLAWIAAHTRRRHIIRAARQSTVIDERQVNAVSARIELDLRLGAAFTRFTSLTLQTLGPPLGGHGENKAQVISYGNIDLRSLCGAWN